MSLDPNRDYTGTELGAVSEEVRQAYYSEREREARRAEKAYKQAQEARDLPMENIPVVSLVPTPAPAQTERMVVVQEPKVKYRNNYLGTGGVAVSLGDKTDLVRGYKRTSLCHTLVEDAVERARLAMRILDAKHASIIDAKLKLASVKSRGASHADLQDEIPFQKAVSIALQAERWVYQAQAAAAKHAAKESKHCLHRLAGKRRRTKEEKEATYLKRYGTERLSKAARTAINRQNAKQKKGE